MEVLQNSTFQLISLANLIESSVNPRRAMNEARLQELTESIRSKGILTPLLVRPSGTYHLDDALFEIAAGHRRYLAAKQAGLTEVPAIVREMSDKDFLEVITIENLQREDVHPLDEANGYRRLIEEHGYDVPGIAGRVGKSESYIYQRLKLSELIPEAQEAFLKEKITAGHAILIARLQKAEQEECLKWCGDRYEGAPSVRQLQSWIENNIHLDLHAAAFKKDDPDLVPEAGPCTTCPKRTGFNPSLFPDIAKKDTCTDPTCYNRKIEAHISQKIEKLREDTDEAVLRLSTQYDDWRSPAEKKEKKPAGSKPVYRKEYVELGKKDEKCESARKGIIVDGENRGKVMTVCADPECKIHHKKDRYGGEIDVKEKARQKAEAEKRKREMAIRTEILDGILENLPATLGEEDLRFIAKEYYRKLWHDFKKVIYKSRHLEPGKNHYGGKDYDQAIEKWIESANPAQLGAFLMEMALVPDTQIGGYETFGGKGDKKKEALEEVAYRHQVDVIGIRARAKEEEGKGKTRRRQGSGGQEGGKSKKLAEVPGKEKKAVQTSAKNKKETNVKRKEKTKTRANRPKNSEPGVCRICGCTEENACEGGCYWVDETKTLCSKCEGKGS